LSSCRKAQEVGRNPPEEKPNIFRPEYCFHVPAISGACLQDTVAGIIDLGNQDQQLFP
jgi:hypothetical protein